MPSSQLTANQRRSRRRRVALQERLEGERAPASSEQPIDHEAARSSARRYVGSGSATARCCSSPSGRACRRRARRRPGLLCGHRAGRLHCARRRFRAVFEELGTPSRSVRGGLSCLRRRNYASPGHGSCSRSRPPPWLWPSLRRSTAPWDRFALAQRRGCCGRGHEGGDRLGRVGSALGHGGRTDHTRRRALGGCDHSLARRRPFGLS
jgi:hypothetical protein